MTKETRRRCLAIFEKMLNDYSKNEFIPVVVVFQNENKNVAVQFFGKNLTKEETKQYFDGLNTRIQNANIKPKNEEQ